jgi:hypothetical protein
MVIKSNVAIITATPLLDFFPRCTIEKTIVVFDLTDKLLDNYLTTSWFVKNRIFQFWEKLFFLQNFLHFYRIFHRLEKR